MRLMAFIAFALIGFQSIEPTHAAAEVPPIEKVGKAVVKYTERYKDQAMQISFEPSRVPPGFYVSCPMGMLCPSENYKLRYRATRRDGSSLWLAFGISDFASLSFDVFQHSFTAASFEIHLESLFKFRGYKITNDASDVDGHIRRADAGQWMIDGFNGEKLKGGLRKTIKELVITRTDTWAERNCGASASGLPDGCQLVVNVNIPVEFAFDLPAETKGLDCRGTNPDLERCGK